MTRTAPGRRSKRWSIGFALIVLGAAPSAAFGQDSGLTAEIQSDQWVPPEAAWKYFRGTSEPSGGTLAWTERHFNDGGWENGRAGFGFGDADYNTLLLDMSGRYSTVYLRKVFEVPSPEGAGDLELSVDYDDGFVAYLNGREIARANAGNSLSFNSFSTGSHEAGEPDTFPVAGSLLTAGVNVLAVIGLNSSLASGDFSLHPTLGSGGAAAEGCPGDHYLASAGVRLAGKAPLPATSEVLVNGQRAIFEAATGDWSFTAALTVPLLEFQVEARDGNGAPIASRKLRAIRASILGGRLETDTVLKSAGSPYLVLRDLVVPAGRRLAIEAGCELLFRPEAGFEIQGEIQARGTLAAPIRFTRLPCGENWRNFRFEESRSQNFFHYCEWSFGSGISGAAGCLTLDDSNLELESCVIRDIDGEGVHAVDSTVRIRNCLTERTREALSLDSGDTVVEYCTVRDAIGKADLIDCNRSDNPPARIAFNHIYNTSDDGIDADDGAVFAEGNIIHDCGDQAISLVGDGSSRVLRNLCYRNGNGLSVKDRHECLAEFNTFTLNTVTGVRAIEKTAGGGGGLITLRNSIVWGNEVQLLVESSGEIDAEYCDVQGTAPPGPGNRNLDPLFFDPDTLQFQLRAGSPCIGAADEGGDLGAFPFEGSPNAPTNLLAGVAASDRVLLSWRDNSFVEEGFEVERAAGAGAYQLRASLAAGTNSFGEGGLASGSTYHYRVRAFNARGSSEYSNVASFTGTVSTPRPEILGMEPGEGPAAGGTAVVIRGRNFEAGVTARLGGAYLLDLEVVNAGEIHAMTPAGLTGPADLRVASGGAEAMLPGAFRYYESHLRGDANRDGSRNVSDVLSILVYLFQAGPPPPCEEVADVQQSGEVDIGDALSLLFYLFRAGPAPEPDQARCFE